jgi:hypothetical protein
MLFYKNVVELLYLPLGAWERAFIRTRATLSSPFVRTHYSGNTLPFGTLPTMQSTAWIFHFLFSATCLKKPVFSKRDLLWWKVPAKLHWEIF